MVVTTNTRTNKVDSSLEKNTYEQDALGDSISPPINAYSPKPQPEVIRDSYPDFRIDPDPGVHRITPVVDSFPCRRQSFRQVL